MLIYYEDRVRGCQGCGGKPLNNRPVLIKIMAEKRLTTLAIAAILLISLTVFSGCLGGDDDTERKAEISVEDAEIRGEDTHGNPPARGHEFVYLKVEVESKVEDDLSLDFLDFTLIADSAYQAEDQDPEIEELPAGNTVKFWLGFEIREDETGETLRYAPDWLDVDEYEMDEEGALTSDVPSYKD